MTKQCFVVCPIGEENTDIRNHSDNVFNHLISSVCSDLGFTTIRADRINKSGLIIDDIFNYLDHAELVIADVTSNNANVFLEIGYRLKTQLPIILIRDKSVHEEFPFDISNNRIMLYDLMPAGLDYSKKLLSDYIANSLDDFEKLQNQLKAFTSSKGKVILAVDSEGNTYPSSFYKPKESE